MKLLKCLWESHRGGYRSQVLVKVGAVFTFQELPSAKVTSGIVVLICTNIGKKIKNTTLHQSRVLLKMTKREIVFYSSANIKL